MLLITIIYYNLLFIIKGEAQNVYCDYVATQLRNNHITVEIENLNKRKVRNIF